MPHAVGVVTQYWRQQGGRVRAFELGARHGAFCVGCCWALMLLMFAVGAGNIGWMLALGAVMAIEKNWSWGRKSLATAERQQRHIRTRLGADSHA